MEEASSYVSTITNMVITFAPKVLMAIVALWGGFWVIRKICNVIRVALVKANFSADITPFLVSIAGAGMKIMLLLAVAGIIGIETASFVAVLAAAGFAVGLALQGSLGNFAAGIIILVLRPYKVGDWVEVDGRFGKVEEIQIFSTTIGTPGLKELIIPNGKVIDNTVTNFSTKGVTRIELEVTMPYEESFPKVQAIIMEVLKSIPKVVEKPEPEVGILSFDSHNIILAVRPYVLPDDYWEVTFETNQRIKAAFNKHNIRVAYSEGVEIGNIGD